MSSTQTAALEIITSIVITVLDALPPFHDVPYLAVLPAGEPVMPSTLFSLFLLLVCIAYVAAADLYKVLDGKHLACFGKGYQVSEHYCR